MKPLTHDQKSIRSNGYTLVEVLVAIAIFSIGFLAVGSMQISAIKTNANARNQTTVLTYAKDKVEDLMALNYLDDLLMVGKHPDDFADFTQANDGIDNDENGQIDDEAAGTGHISITWEVESLPLEGMECKKVSVTVTRNAAGRQRQASLDFIKAPF